MTANYYIIQELVKCLSGIGIRRAGITNQEIVDMFFADVPPAIHSEVGERELIRLIRSMRSGCIYRIRGALSTCYIWIYNEPEQEHLMIGPCLLAPLSEEEVNLQLRSTGLESHLQQIMADYLRKLPIVPPETFHQLGVLVANYLTGIPRPVPCQQVDYRWEFENRRAIVLVDHYEDLGKMRQVELRYEISAAMTEAVKQGNLSLAYEMLYLMNEDMSIAARNPNPLRNIQNICIILNSQLRHSMEDCGIHPYHLDRISHEIAVRIEKLKSVTEANEYIMEIIRRYCNLAREKAYPDLKPFTRLAVTYIKEHLSDNLTVKGTAQALLVNANYLSYQFHQDMGMTFIDFVNQERIKQAASLLKHTNLQIQQIASVVGYNNTSYFSKQFVKYLNMTPRNYRNSDIL